MFECVQSTLFDNIWEANDLLLIKMADKNHLILVISVINECSSIHLLSNNAQWSKVLMHGRNIYFGYVWDK